MARIRTVKPEFPQHRKVRRVSRDARLLCIHLWNLADDEGRLQELPNAIIGAVFPEDDDVTPVVLREWLGELQVAGLIHRYEVDGERYIECHDFRDHQVVNKPRPSDFPAYEAKYDISRSATVGLPESDGTATGGNREQGTGKGTGKQPVDEQKLADRVDEVKQVFDAWVEATGKRKGATKLTDDRRRLIRKALKSYPVEDLVDAVRGWRHSPHHRGENDRHTVYNDIELLLRNAKQIETFRDLERGASTATDSWSDFLAVES